MRYLSVVSVTLFLCLSPANVPVAVALQEEEQELPEEQPAVVKKQTTVVEALKKIAGTSVQLEGSISIIFLVDRSRSMTDDVRVAAERLKESFGKLVDGREVAMRLASYDKHWQFLTKWETALEPISQALEKMSMEGSGEERVMQAVQELAEHCRPMRNRMIVVLTDEAGADVGRLEQAIKAATLRKVRVHVIGPEAPFGWPFQYEAGDRFYVATDGGPESVRCEILQINPICFDIVKGPKRAVYPDERLKLTAGGNPYRCDLGFDSDIGSGFGPYGLVRLARETEGSFAFLRASAYTEESLRLYAPDWCSVEEYEQRSRQGIPASVFAVLREWPSAETRDGRPWKYPFLPQKISVGNRQEIVDRVRRLISLADKHLKHLGNLPIETGGAEGNKRWIANASLVKAQLAALKHYLQQYLLAIMTWDPPNTVKEGSVSPGPRLTAKEDPPAVRVDGAHRPSAVSADEFFEAAKTFLSDVVNDHAGTPWAETAGENLNRLGGFRIVDIKPPPPVVEKPRKPPQGPRKDDPLPGPRKPKKEPKPTPAIPPPAEQPR